MDTSGKEERSSMIRIKGGYSERSGEILFEDVLQVNDFDERTRELLSNLLFEVLQNQFAVEEPYSFYNSELKDYFCKVIRADVFGESTRLSHGQNYYWENEYEKINEVIKYAPYNEVLDIIEYTLGWLCNNIKNKEWDFYNLFNQLFEKECVGYRFIDGLIVAITDENEIDEIEIACQCPYEGCRTHIKNAVKYLSDRDRDNKDYKNSIKESISAIEAICRIITGDKNATLGQAIKKLKDSGLELHPALEKAFLALYGYSGDQGGIRHSEGMFESNVTFEEAKFMLVICSAFLNYLIAESEEIF